MLGNLNTIPHVGTMRQGGMPGYIKRSLAYFLGSPVDNGEYPNKIGDESREVQPGRALAFDGVDQYASVADNGALDIASTEPVDVTDDLSVSDCENSVTRQYTTFSDASPDGFSVVSDGSAIHTAGTDVEVPITIGKPLIVTFDLVLNSGTAPLVAIVRDLETTGPRNEEGYVSASPGVNSIKLTPTESSTEAIQFRNTSSTTDYTISNLSVKEVSYDFVLSGWLKTSSDITTYQSTFGKGIGGAISGRYEFYINGGALVAVTATDGGAVSITDNITLATDTEYHLIQRFDLVNDLMYFYIDGVLQNAGGTALPGAHASLSSGYKFYAGATSNSGGTAPTAYLDGRLRDIRIYHKDITAQLPELMKGERLGDEVAWWFCEGTDLLEVHDASGNDYHMTAANFDSTSFVEGTWQSLYNKFGYNEDVGGMESVSQLVNGSTYSFDTVDIDGVDVNSAINASGNAMILQEEVVDVSLGEVFRVTCDVTLNSGVSPTLALYTNAQAISGTSSSVVTLVDGHNDFLLTVTIAGDNKDLGIRINGAVDMSILNISLKREYDTAIPPDMSTGAIPTHDILGNELVNAGQAKYPAIARDRSCFVGDGAAKWSMSDDIIIDPDLDSFEFEFGVHIGVRDSNYLAAHYNSTARLLFHISSLYLADDSNNLGGGSWAALMAGVSDNTYTVFKLVGDGTDIKGYINGELLETRSAALWTSLMTISSSIAYIFRDGSNGGAPEWARPQFYRISKNGVDQANWQFCEGSGNTVYDVSVDENLVANGNHLTGVNVDDNNWGVIDYPDEDYLGEHGLNMYGNFQPTTEDRIDLNEDLVIPYDGDVSILVRFRRTITGSTDYILGNSITNGYRRLICTGGGDLYLESDTDNNSIITTNAVVDDTEWHDLELRIISGVPTIILDGIERLVEGTLTNSFTAQRIGSCASVYSRLQIDYVKVLNNATGEYLLDANITGLDYLDTFGTWSGTGNHTLIIPALADKSTDAVGQPITYPQNGRNLVPHTYISMPEVYELIDADSQDRYKGGLMDEGKGMFNGGDTESWVAYGANTIENDGDALKITYVDNANGAYTFLTEATELTQNLIVGDTYRYLCRMKVSAGASVLPRIYTGSSYVDAETFTSEEWKYVVIDFIANSTSTARPQFTNLSAGEIIWIDSWELFHKVTHVGNNLIPNGGARNEIGALIAGDWVDTNSDGLSDGILHVGAPKGTVSIVTGNGFIGNAQRVQVDVDTEWLALQFSNVFSNDYVAYNIKAKIRTNKGFIFYQSSLGNLYQLADTSETVLDINVDVNATFSGAGDDQLRIYFFGITSVLAGDYFEIDELEVRPIIDGEFFEPIELGQDAVIVSTNYLAENPYRYLARYFNAVDWKDLMLMINDNTLTYDDHLKILKLTKNT